MFGLKSIIYLKTAYARVSAGVVPAGGAGQAGQPLLAGLEPCVQVGEEVVAGPGSRAHGEQEKC